MPATPAAGGGLDEGDPAPPLQARDETGAPFSSLDDRIAGRPLMLAFCAAPEREATVRRLREAAAAAAALDATLRAISRLSIPDNRRWAEAAALPCRVLADMSGAIFAAYGVDAAPDAEPVVITLDGAHRVLSIGAAVPAPRPAAPAPRLAQHPPVLVLPRVLNAAERAFLMAVADGDVPVWETDGFTNDGFRHERGDFKVHHAGAYGVMTEYVVQEPALQRFLDERLHRRVIPELAKAFQTVIARREGYRIIRYVASEGGVLAPHRDNSVAANAHRRFTLTVNLNGGAYRGGELRFPEYGDQLYDVPPGTGILWSAALLHEVLPVTAGERLVCGVHLFG
jgi:peroxiredoxin